VIAALGLEQEPLAELASEQMRSRYLDRLLGSASATAAS